MVDDFNQINRGPFLYAPLRWLIIGQLTCICYNKINLQFTI